MYQKLLSHSFALFLILGISQANDLALFQTPLAEALKSGTTKQSVASINNKDLRLAAQQMLANNYPNAYRIIEVQPMLAPSSMGEKLAIGKGYGLYQGVTGIVLQKGENTILVEGLEEGKKAAILIPQWQYERPFILEPVTPEMKKQFDRDKDGKLSGDESKAMQNMRKSKAKQNNLLEEYDSDKNGTLDKAEKQAMKEMSQSEYTLHNGINKISLHKEGLAYISYFFEEPEKEKNIKLHFVNAKVNGYFDITKHDNQDWDTLLDKACYPIIDAIGKNIQIAYPVKTFQQYTKSKGVELVKIYDRICQMEYDLMGLPQYKRSVPNKILARATHIGLMYKDVHGTAYNHNTMHFMAEPNEIISNSWGIAHEIGHAHQLRPEFNWSGLGEVSNNIFSLYVTTSLGNKSRLSEEGSYQRAREEIINTGKSYLELPNNRLNIRTRLVPFWQLQLYFTRHGYPDFYPDLFEALRRQNAEALATGTPRDGKIIAPLQLNFIKQACIVSQTDLTDFFEKWGFFKVGEWEVNDYETGVYKMTAEMVQSCKEEIAAMNLPKPQMDITTCED